MAWHVHLMHAVHGNLEIVHVGRVQGEEEPRYTRTYYGVHLHAICLVVPQVEYEVGVTIKKL